MTVRQARFWTSAIWIGLASVFAIKSTFGFGPMSATDNIIWATFCAAMAAYTRP